MLNDPVGNRLEIFHGAETTAEPFKPGRSISGFRTGPLGLGHVVLNVDTAETIERLTTFYRDTLGFRLTDYYSHPFIARFLHLNPRHHSLAFVQSGKNAVHHLMMELFSFDDVGQGYDLALGEEGRVAVTLGRHTSDFITSFYSWTPSSFMVEYGWGARLIDVDTWQAYERKEGPSMWGHDRGWLSAADQAKARALRLENAANGLSPPGPGDGWQLRSDVRRLSLVGQRQGARGGAIAGSSASPRRPGRAMGKDRLAAFSDGVVAILITIMVLELQTAGRRPIGRRSRAWRRASPATSSASSIWGSIGTTITTCCTRSRGSTGVILWANLHLLFWLSLIPAATAWMGLNLLAPLPTAVYGGALLMPAIAYFLLQLAIVHQQGADSVLAKALGPRRQGQDIAGLLHRRDRAGVRQSVAVDGALCAGRGDVARARPADRKRAA